MSKTLVCGPWFGEIGLFVMWLAGARYIANKGEYERVVVIGPEGWACLADDFASHYAPHPFKGVIACGAYGKLGTQPPEVAIAKCISEVVEAVGLGPGDDYILFQAVETHIVSSHPGNLFREPMGQNAEFVKYGEPEARFQGAIAVHARWRTEWGDDRNWSAENWAAFMGHFRREYPAMPVFSIGSREGALCVNGSIDYRGIPVSELCNLLASVWCLAGPSSGPSHVGSLCGCPLVVWVGYDGIKLAILTDRYMKPYPAGWNPHRAPVACLRVPDWNPPPERIAGAVCMTLQHLGAGSATATALAQAEPASAQAAPEVQDTRGDAERGIRPVSPLAATVGQAGEPVGQIQKPVGVAMICYRNPEDVDRCAESIRANTWHFEPIILDNSEDDPRICTWWIAGHRRTGLGGCWDDCTYLHPGKQYGCWRGRNIIFAHCEAMGYAAFVVIDSDVVVTADDWLDRMLAKMNAHPDAAVVGWNTANILGRELGPNGEIVEMPGMCCLYRSEAVRDVGGWDRDFYPFHSGDTDFCLRVQTVADHPRFASRPWRCYLVPGEPAIEHRSPHSGVSLHPDYAAVVERSMATLARKTAEYRGMGIDYPIMENIRHLLPNVAPAPSAMPALADVNGALLGEPL